LTGRSGKLIYFLARAFRRAGALTWSVSKPTQSLPHAGQDMGNIGWLDGTHHHVSLERCYRTRSYPSHAAANPGDHIDHLATSWSIPQPVRNSSGWQCGMSYRWTGTCGICSRNLTKREPQVRILCLCVFSRSRTWAIQLCRIHIPSSLAHAPC